MTLEDLFKDMPPINLSSERGELIIALRGAKEIVEEALGLTGDSVLRAQATLIIMLRLLAKEQQPLRHPMAMAKFQPRYACPYFIYAELSSNNRWVGHCDVTGSTCDGETAVHSWQECTHYRIRQHITQKPEPKPAPPPPDGR